MPSKDDCRNVDIEQVMNFIILDFETETPLYGHALLQRALANNREFSAQVYRIAAETWIAFLHARYSRVPEVMRYLAAVEAGEGINPQNGKLLRAVDNAIDVPLEEWGTALRLIKASGE
jgi:hypothetical protein